MKEIIIQLRELNDLNLIEIKDFNIPKEASNKRGIYFILNDKKEVIYIGQSEVCIYKRLYAHISPKNNTRFSIRTPHELPNSYIPLGAIYYVSWIEIEELEKLNFIEQLYINYYKPYFNQKNGWDKGIPYYVKNNNIKVFSPLNINKKELNNTKIS